MLLDQFFMSYYSPSFPLNFAAFYTYKALVSTSPKNKPYVFWQRKTVFCKNYLKFFTQQMFLSKFQRKKLKLLLSLCFLGAFPKNFLKPLLDISLFLSRYSGICLLHSGGVYPEYDKNRRSVSNFTQLPRCCKISSRQPHERIVFL